MQNKGNRKSKNLWLAALVLFVCVAATTVAVMERLNLFMLDDSGAIVLAADMADVSEDESQDTNVQSEENETGSVDDIEQREVSDVETENSEKHSHKHGFEASDEQKIWETNTKVDIFHVSYENGEQVVTVNSGNGDKLIAPGTENSYVFKLKNTGEVALDYTVEVEAYFAPEDMKIPITGRINRYDGEWIAGNQNEYVEMSELDGAYDEAILGAGKYTYYILDWQWPFETGNDEHDTMLGNLAIEEDLTLTIEIKTTATCSANPGDGSGITAPKTGDNNNLTLWIMLISGAFLVILFFLFRRDEEEDSDMEAI